MPPSQCMQTAVNAIPWTDQHRSSLVSSCKPIRSQIRILPCTPFAYQFAHTGRWGEGSS